METATATLNVKRGAEYDHDCKIQQALGTLKVSHRSLISLISLNHSSAICTIRLSQDMQSEENLLT